MSVMLPTVSKPSVADSIKRYLAKNWAFILALISGIASFICVLLIHIDTELCSFWFVTLCLATFIGSLYIETAKQPEK